MFKIMRVRSSKSIVEVWVVGGLAYLDGSWYRLDCFTPMAVEFKPD